MAVKGMDKGMLGYCAQSCYSSASTNPKNPGSLLEFRPPEAFIPRADGFCLHFHPILLSFQYNPELHTSLHSML